MFGLQHTITSAIEHETVSILTRVALTRTRNFVSYYSFFFILDTVTRVNTYYLWSNILNSDIRHNIIFGSESNYAWLSFSNN